MATIPSETKRRDLDFLLLWEDKYFKYIKAIDGIDWFQKENIEVTTDRLNRIKENKLNATTLVET